MNRGSMHAASRFAYDPQSGSADEFINHEEIMATLAFAGEHKDDIELCSQILDKAEGNLHPSREHGTIIDHREASVLLACGDPGINRRIKALAHRIKKAYYGNRIVLFAPLYLSNHCINGCLYCPYHSTNKEIPRRKLTQEEIALEVRALQDMGHKRLAIEAGEDPYHNPLDYILESIETIYGVRSKNGSIRRVNVNIAATTEEDYARLKDAGIGTYILFQETYRKSSYEQLHPTGPKSDYDWHTEAHDRAMRAGIDDVGLGVLFGLESYDYELAGLLMHAEHLESAFGVGPHTISVPRIKPADDIDPEEFDNGVPDELFEKIIAVIRIAVPYTGMIISTRESEAVRRAALELGVSQISGGSRTSVGGYTEDDRPHDTEQFDVSDQRSLDEVIGWLLANDHIPSFCTACYREGRTGDRFMEFCKNGLIGNYCRPNALITLQEYISDYASPEVARLGEEMIDRELESLRDVRGHEDKGSTAAARLEKALNDIRLGEIRDIRF